MERFWSKVEKVDGGCWEWTASKLRGYGRFSAPGRRNVYAHRWAYEDRFGPIPVGLQIDHLCRNESCVNPDHLEAVTPLVNTARSLKRKLTDADVEFIRTSGESCRALQRRFGISETHVNHIRAGKRRKEAAA